jgi:hypothetical protein
LHLCTFLSYATGAPAALLKRDDDLAKVASFHQSKERLTLVNSLDNVLFGRVDLARGDLAGDDIVEIADVGLEDDEAAKGRVSGLCRRAR